MDQVQYLFALSDYVGSKVSEAGTALNMSAKYQKLSLLEQMLYRSEHIDEVRQDLLQRIYKELKAKSDLAAISTFKTYCKDIGYEI